MPAVPPEQFADLEFPVQGIDVTTEFELQRDGTTPMGVNVRAFEPTTGRCRGGTRSGLSRFIDETVT